MRREERVTVQGPRKGATTRRNVTQGGGYEGYAGEPKIWGNIVLISDPLASSLGHGRRAVVLPWGWQRADPSLPHVSTARALHWAIP